MFRKTSGLRVHEKSFVVAMLVLILEIVFPLCLGSVCNIGDEITAVYAGDGSSKLASIQYIDTTAQTVAVNWNDGSTDHVTIASSNTLKSGTPCTFIVDSMALSADENVAVNLRISGQRLTEACRMYIVDPSQNCGLLSATMHAAVVSPPSAPVGVQDMNFFDVMINTAGTYKLCFWSGSPYNGMDGLDPRSYSTTIGTIVVASTAAPTAAPAPPGSTSLSLFTRRRGTTYSSTSLTASGSGGSVYEGLTANPASWNIYHPVEKDGTCRSCQRFPLSDVNQYFSGRVVNRVHGALTVAPSPTPAAIGEGCTLSTLGGPRPVASSQLILVSRGGCTFLTKAQIAAELGYRGLLVANAAITNTPLSDMAAASTESEEEAPVPGWMLPADEAEQLRLLAGSEHVVIIDIEDIQRKPRTSPFIADSFGLRDYVST